MDSGRLRLHSEELSDCYHGAFGTKCVFKENCVLAGFLVFNFVLFVFGL